jgi:hypothetical protein
VCQVLQNCDLTMLLVTALTYIVTLNKVTGVISYKLKISVTIDVTMETKLTKLVSVKDRGS